MANRGQPIATPTHGELPSPTAPSLAAPQEVAVYVREMSDALRTLTRSGRDLAFLDYLLAMVSEEAKQVASHQNH